MTVTENKSVYSAFALIYDQVMRDVDYDGWAQHVINLCNRFSIEVQDILELACGTGSLTLRLADAGYDVVGVDQSEEMLGLAKRKLSRRRIKISLYPASMQSFQHLGLSNQFDLVLCLYDSLNYLLNEKDVQKSFEEVYNHLRPGGAFIFDVTTEYNLLHNFSGFTFAENFDSASYIWENAYDIVKKVCSSKVTIFLRKDGDYHKYVEEHLQRVYSNAKILAWLQKAGFQHLGSFHNLSEKPPQDQCERIHYVCQKPL